MPEHSSDIKLNSIDHPHGDGAKASTRSRCSTGADRIDAKHRRWIDQVLAESQTPSVTLPWTRAPEKAAADPARKTRRT